MIKEHAHEQSVVLALQGVRQHYSGQGAIIQVLDNIDFTLRRGQTCAIVGESGSGKSTLLNIMGLLERPASGYFRFAHQDVMRATSRQLAHLRNREIGFVFQSFQLLPALSALENVMLPLELAGMDAPEKRARELLERVGLGERLNHTPRQLSGGEQQRVAIARAFASNPVILFADEPTGNLDNRTGQAVSDLLMELNREQGTTLVMVTHDEHLAARCRRQLHIEAGLLTEPATAREQVN